MYNYTLSHRNPLLGRGDVGCWVAFVKGLGAAGQKSQYAVPIVTDVRRGKY